MSGTTPEDGLLLPACHQDPKSPILGQKLSQNKIFNFFFFFFCFLSIFDPAMDFVPSSQEPDSPYSPDLGGEDFTPQNLQRMSSRRLRNKLFLAANPPKFGDGPDTVSESTVSDTELSEFFGPHQVLGRELSEFLSAYYLRAKANSPSFFVELTEFAAELSEFSLPKQHSQSIPPVSSFFFFFFSKF